MKSQAMIEHFFLEERQHIEARLKSIVETLTGPQSLLDAIDYSLQAGGKRIRPILLLATLQGLNKPLQLGYDVACAIEMIHTYSLVHDDLPAMDDDDLRRGKPTNHKVFGEALAILAGDGLLTHSFNIISRLEDISDATKIQLLQRISEAAGPSGMVAGQVADMEGEGKILSLDELEQIHHRKTGDLLGVSLECGAILGSASMETIAELSAFGKHIGLAFQIKDDVLDVEGDEESIGKPVGSDAESDKNTYPSILGLEEAKEKLDYHIDAAKSHLSNLPYEFGLLEEIADFIKNRTA
nr:farnesyl diphosphate synthase [Salipaludibacillus neizhouensis]